MQCVEVVPPGLPSLATVTEARAGDEVHECRDCHRTGFADHAHADLSFCCSCGTTVASGNERCPECGDDALTLACPDCGGEFLECVAEWTGIPEERARLLREAAGIASDGED